MDKTGKEIKEISINVWKNVEEGFHYNIMVNGTEVDGGLCTTTMASAIGMAKSQAFVIIDKADVKPHGM